MEAGPFSPAPYCVDEWKWDGGLGDCLWFLGRVVGQGSIYLACDVADSTTVCFVVFRRRVDSARSNGGSQRLCNAMGRTGALLVDSRESYGPAGFRVAATEVINYVIDGYGFANYIIMLDKVVAELHEQGQISDSLRDTWDRHKSTGYFKMSFNSVLFSGVRI